MTTVLVFHADWCVPCDEQKPIIEAIEQEHDVEVEWYDVDSEDGMDAANEYNIRSVPTTIVDGGQNYTSFMGLTQKDEIVEAL